METKTELPQFAGKPLIEIPREIPQADFLEGDFGKAVDGEVQGKYGKFQAINKVRYSNGTVKGSTHFYVVAVNEVIRHEGLRTASQADLERVLRTNAFDLRGVYEDSALVLRTENSPNEYLAKHLMKQVKALNPKSKMPVMIPLNSLELVEDSDSSYGLAFKLRDDAEIVYAPILNKSNGNFSSEDIDGKTGLPIKLDSSGNRGLYTTSSGLSRLYLDRFLSLYSRSEDLAYSNDDGRVVIVSSEGASQFFLNEHLTKLQKSLAEANAYNQGIVNEAITKLKR